MKIAALLSAVLLLAALVAVAATDSRNTHISISERAASRRWSYLLFALSLSIFGSLLFLYLLVYFGRQFGLPPIYYGALFTGWACLLLTAWIPDRGLRNFTNPHWKTAFGLAVSMTVMAMSLIAARQVDGITRLLSLVVSCWYCYTLYVWLYKTNSFQLYLKFEAINITCFMGLLALTLFFR